MRVCPCVVRWGGHHGVSAFHDSIAGGLIPPLKVKGWGWGQFGGMDVMVYKHRSTTHRALPVYVQWTYTYTLYQVKAVVYMCWVYVPSHEACTDWGAWVHTLRAASRCPFVCERGFWLHLGTKQEVVSAAVVTRTVYTPLTRESHVYLTCAA